MAYDMHAADDLFPSCKELIDVYSKIIKEKTVEINGFHWPIDLLIVYADDHVSDHCSCFAKSG